MALQHSPVVVGKLAEHYAKNYYEIEDDIFLVFEKMDTPFLDARLKPGMVVLDAMMGRGRHAIRYAKRGCQVWGNDFNPHMVKIARAAAKRAGVKMRLSALDACDLKGVRAGTFDATYAMYSSVGTIPRRADRQRAISSMSRVTKQGGLVMVHAHNFLDCFLDRDFLPWAVKSCIKPDAGLGRGDMVTDYNGLREMFNHYYTPGELRRAFKRAGLKVIEEHYMDYENGAFLDGPLRKLRADGFIFVGRKL